MNAMYESEYLQLGLKIAYYRKLRGLTQEQLATRLGISAQSVSKWENTVTMPDISLLPALAEELGVTIDELFDMTAELKLQRALNRISVGSKKF